MSSSAKRSQFRKLNLESLESRRLMTLPFGAATTDLGEFMLGRVAVTPVLLESNGPVNTEDWTQAHVQEVKQNIEAGLKWWKDLLATKSSLHTLDWVIDTTYLENRLSTMFEPITMNSNGYTRWVPEFLGQVGFSSSPDIASNIRSFNHSQRLKNSTDWSFTIFVVNAKNDSDGAFAPGGPFSRAFAFAGGLFQVVPSTRPASTYAHETGHMFWARDEYAGGGDYHARRGYYNAQNRNAVDGNPDPNFVQEPSIMSAGSNLQFAYDNIVTSNHTLAQIGWLDSDGDQIFDVLDVPFALTGTGRISTDGNRYRFVGRAVTQTLPNRNSSGNQNDITLNKIDRIQYRINGGNWTTALTPGTYTVDLDLDIPLGVNQGTIEIRALNDRLGITSNLFTGQIGPVPDTTTAPGIQGFVWEDANDNGQWSRNENGLRSVTVAIVDNNDQPITIQKKVEPDNFPPGEIENNQDGVRLEVFGSNTNGRIAVGSDLGASTGTRIFKPVAFNGTTLDAFNENEQQLRARFTTPTTYAALDAIAFIDGTNVRLEAFDASNNLIQRAEHRGMLAGQKLKLEVGSQLGNISYVVARAFGGSTVKFDHLRFGSVTSTVTASDGSYRFPFLPAGNYRLKLLNPPVGNLTAPVGGVQTVQLGAGATVSHVDFGLHLTQSPWKNRSLPEDVDNDGNVSPLDVLELINEINARGARLLDGSGLSFPPYYDPNGDRSLDALDVLQVINYVNDNPPPNGGGPSGEGADIIAVQSGPVVPFTSFAFDTLSSLPTTRIVHRSSSVFAMSGENELDHYDCDHDHSNDRFDDHPAENKTGAILSLIPPSDEASGVEHLFHNLGDACCCPNCAFSNEGDFILDLLSDPSVTGVK